MKYGLQINQLSKYCSSCSTIVVLSYVLKLNSCLKAIGCKVDVRISWLLRQYRPYCEDCRNTGEFNKIPLLYVSKRRNPYLSDGFSMCKVSMYLSRWSCEDITVSCLGFPDTKLRAHRSFFCQSEKPPLSTVSRLNPNLRISYAAIIDLQTASQLCVLSWGPIMFSDSAQFYMADNSCIGSRRHQMCVVETWC